MFNRHLYIPRVARIESIKELTPDTKLFQIAFIEKDSGLCAEGDFLPGQFVQVSVFGIGEIPVSIASSPTDKKCMELSVKKVGFATDALHRLEPQDKIGIRGPYGNYFPVEDIQSKRFLFVGGGCGLAPLRSLMKFMVNNSKKYPKPTVLYGARTSEDILFKDELSSLRESKRADVRLSVDCGPVDPDYNVGVVTTLFKQFDDLRGSVAFVCGPTVMLHFVVKELLNLNLKEEDIILSLERYMKCGVGKCGHCYIKDKYVCTDGPIFSYKQLKEMGVEL